LRNLDVDLPLGVYAAVTGVSGSGKSTLVVKVLGDVVNSHLGTGRAAEPAESDEGEADSGIVDLDHDASVGVTAAGVEEIDRLVSVDQRPIGRTPRSDDRKPIGTARFVSGVRNSHFSVGRNGQ
jgi:excinuclease ABC subunit A